MLSFTIIASIINMNDGTPLDDYVNRPDSAFAWKVIQSYPSSTYTVYILNMTSQKWFDASFSSQSIWWHHMVIIVPKTLKRPENAFMLIGGGSNNDPAPSESSTTALALAAGSVTIELKQIPNQPIIFVADPLQTSRSEDAIIAWTWKTFIEANGSDPFVLLRMPMTKAAVRAMDATQQFLRQQEIQVPDKFVISGLSKRGWTTWTTAAVDNKRVIGAVPIVMDILNLHKNMMSHYRSLAGWTFAFYNYYIENTTRYLDNPYFQMMADIVDPYSYFDRYRNVKILQFQAADDQFFLPDSEDFFWSDLQVATGGSFLRRIPNVGHGISGYDESLQSFYLSVCDARTLPSLSWTRTQNETYGHIRANVSTDGEHPTPLQVTVYQARTVTGTKRDFRQNIIDPTTGKVVSNPVKWLQVKDNIEISHIGQSIIYTYSAPIPPTGYWDGLFMQLTFPGPENTNLTLTTETLIIPNTYPLGPCSGEQCYGTLV
jgi:PhoPQ-activated pathogenicity-related protein